MDDIPDDHAATETAKSGDRQTDIPELPPSKSGLREIHPEGETRNERG